MGNSIKELDIKDSVGIMTTTEHKRSESNIRNKYNKRGKAQPAGRITSNTQNKYVSIKV